MHITDVHTGALTHCLESFENSYVFGTVFVLGTRCFFSLRRQIQILAIDSLLSKRERCSRGIWTCFVYPWNSPGASKTPSHSSGFLSVWTLLSRTQPRPKSPAN